MNVLITGGTGFIGSRLALDCLKLGYSVTVLGQENTPAEQDNKALMERKGAKVILATVTERDRVIEAMKGVDTVFHLAAAQHEANVPDQHFWDVNVTGTQNVLDAAVDAGVTRFVHGSTIGVYGSAMEGTLSEKSPLKPDNVYGVTKLEGEKLALSYLDRMPVVVIRISETYGPGDRRLLKLFKAINKRKFFMIGPGVNIHHPIFVDDLVQGFQLAATSDDAVGHIFLLSGKQSFTTNEMVDTIATQLGAKPRGFRAPMFPFVIAANVAVNTVGRVGIQPPIHPRMMDFFRKSFVLAHDEAKQTMGFDPKYSFSEGVRETAQWYSQKGYL